ncbi:glycosyltransferase family 2 protein [Thorsellia anophelis]|uniref:Rhamnosyltransferase n=1 Tax=Thorsellia anophelis DSM 18579 TaxID=1123402 RepID=A0A1I0FXA2_9GAMM|nr:glycosyltransferase family 2 protein [Thorsellia anophelis]SET63140.1 rhamnosyltransferase [Thorsellia anophelis DSM 18579]
MQVAAIVVTYEPDSDLITRLHFLAAQVEVIYIVDNGSSRFYSRFVNILGSNISNKIILISLEENLGIATALNIGCKYAENDNYDFVVTFDQDSCPELNYITELLNTYRRKSLCSNVAIVGGIINEAIRGNSNYQYLTLSRWGFKRIRESEDFSVMMLITSGCLVDLSVIKRIGGFIDKLFIDYVDTEFSLRCLDNNYTLWVSTKAILNHNLGNKTEHYLFKFRFLTTNHSPIRRYYMARNSVYMYKRYAWRFFGWFLFDISALIYTLFKIIIFEESKFLKLKMYFRGWVDGLCGNFGKFKE